VQLNREFRNLEAPSYVDLFGGFKNNLSGKQIAMINPYFVNNVNRKVMRKSLRTLEVEEVIDLEKFSELYKSKLN